MVDKLFLNTIIIVLWVFASIWCFNHVDAWIGIAAFTIGIYILVKQIFKNNKNQIK